MTTPAPDDDPATGLQRRTRPRGTDHARLPSMRLSYDMPDNVFWAAVADLKAQREADADHARRRAVRVRVIAALVLVFLLGQLLEAALNLLA